MTIGIILLLIILFVLIYGILFSDFLRDFLDDLPHFSDEYTKYCGKNPNGFLFLFYCAIFVFTLFVTIGAYVVGICSGKRGFELKQYCKNTKISLDNIKKFFAFLLIIILVVILIFFITAVIDIITEP